MAKGKENPSHSLQKGLSEGISILKEKLGPGLSRFWANSEKRNLSLALFNLFLAFLLLFQFNLIGLFPTGYGASKLLIDLEQEDVDAIEIDDPDFKNKRVRLVRQKEKSLPREKWYSKGEQKQKSFPNNLYERVAPQYEWELEIYTLRKEEGAGSKSVYPVDVQRIAEFFTSLRKARRYYAIPRSPEKEKAIGMQKDSQSRYANLKINFFLSPQKKTTLYFGRAGASSSENYVRRDEEKNIYLVQTDLRSKSGSAEVAYFRSRQIFDSGISEKGLLSVMFQSKAGDAIAQFVYNGKEWNLQFPNPSLRGAKVRSNAIQSFVQDMLSWKATEFPDTLAKGLDSRYAFRIVLRYKKKDEVQEKELILNVLGREGYSDYLLSMPDQSLRKISSVYLEDILDPLKNFTEAAQKKK